LLVSAPFGLRSERCPAPRTFPDAGTRGFHGIGSLQIGPHLLKPFPDPRHRIALEGHEKAAQIARHSPDGKYLIVTSYDAPLGTIFDAKLETQKLLQLGRGPMNTAFHPDGRILLIANHDAGSLAVVDLEKAEVLRTVPAGVGVETLSFY
jgi:hypothetical protein